MGTGVAEGGVDDDSPDPAVERAFAAKVRSSSHGMSERILDGVPGELAVARDGCGSASKLGQLAAVDALYRGLGSTGLFGSNLPARVHARYDA